MRSALFERSGLTGVLSPKFFAKTGLTSDDVQSWIADNPGYDLYCIDGRPFVPYAYYNAMERAERRHGPHFEQRLRSLAAEIGLELPGGSGRQTSEMAFHCNYWIGTQAFWHAWGRDVVGPIWRLRETASGIARVLFQRASYRSPTPVFLIAFIYERMLSMYLASRTVRHLAYPWTGAQVLRLDYQPAFRAYLEAVVPWVEETDRRLGWTNAQRVRLLSSHEEIRRQPMIEGYEADAFDPFDYDLPRCRPVLGHPVLHASGPAAALQLG